MSIKQAIEAMDRTNHELDNLAYASSEDYTAIRKAAPDMAAWIKKALPYLRGDLADQFSAIKEYPKLAAINPQWREIATELTSLIAEATND